MSRSFEDFLNNLLFLFVLTIVSQVRKVSRFLVKTISAPLPVLEVVPSTHSTVLEPPLLTPPAATSIPSMMSPPEFFPPAGPIQRCQLPPVVCQEPVANVPVPQSGPTQIPTTSNAAGNDLGAAFVTVALSINITSNGIYATSRCSSPARAPNSANAQGDLSVSTAAVPLKLCLGETNKTG